jgi:hypothetical protein
LPSTLNVCCCRCSYKHWHFFPSTNWLCSIVKSKREKYKMISLVSNREYRRKKKKGTEKKIILFKNDKEIYSDENKSKHFFFLVYFRHGILNRTLVVFFSGWIMVTEPCCASFIFILILQWYKKTQIHFIIFLKKNHWWLNVVDVILHILVLI